MEYKVRKIRLSSKPERLARRRGFFRRAFRIEERSEQGCDPGRVARFDVGAVDHRDELSVAKECERRRRGGHLREVTAGPHGRLPVTAGEDGGDDVRTNLVREGVGERRARDAAGTAADGVHEQERGPFVRGKESVDLFRRTEFSNAEAGDFALDLLHENIVHKNDPLDERRMNH